MGKEKTFAVLANDIKDINVRAGNAAKGAVNQLMTLRNSECLLIVKKVRQCRTNLSQIRNYL